MEKKGLIELGACRKPHGIKGAAVVQLHNAKDSILKKGMKVHVGPLGANSSLDEEGEVFTIKSISFGNKVIIFFEEVEDRNRLESLLPFQILVERSAFPDLKEGEVYLGDLVSMDVFDLDGNPLGSVTGIGDNGVQAILQVEGDESFDVLFMEPFIKEVDFQENKIIIVKPELI